MSQKSNQNQAIPSQSPWAFLLIGTGVFFGLYWSMYQRIPLSANVTSDIERIFCVLRWHGITALFLLVMAIRLGFLQLSKLMASSLKGDLEVIIIEKQKVNHQVMIDSLIHTFIFFVASLAYTAIVPLEHFSIVAVGIILFTLGRVIYLIGYQINPKYRAFALPFTYLPHFYVATKILENFFLEGF